MVSRSRFWACRGEIAAFACKIPFAPHLERVIMLAGKGSGHRQECSMRSRIGMVVALGTLLFAASVGEAVADRRVALVIGNSGYQYAPTLPNPINDAGAVGIALRQIGFEVVEARDLGNAEMRRTLRDFTDRTSNADIALVYFAGHGIEVGGSNFLVPVDARLERDIDAEDEAV